jgi:glycerol-3-phosphate acyltransferase PlsY
VNEVLAVVLGWLAGTIPCSWLLVRWRTGKDLAAEGSGNVGALNSLRVSRSRGLGALALVLDLLKGCAAVFLARALGSGPAIEHAAGVAAVAGHSLNPWLSLRRGRVSGGKGFATAAGALLVLAPWLVGLWVAVLVVAYALLRATWGQRDEAPASLLATWSLPVAAFLDHAPLAAWATVAMALMMSTRLVPEVLGLLRSPRPPSDAAPGT